MIRRPAKLGLPVARPAGQPTPCWHCPKIPEDAPARTAAYATDLTERNQAAYLHYLACKAVGRFPEDDIVRRNARLIRAAEDAIGAARLARVEELLRFLLVGGTARG